MFGSRCATTRFCVDYPCVGVVSELGQNFRCANGMTNSADLMSCAIFSTGRFFIDDPIAVGMAKSGQGFCFDRCIANGTDLMPAAISVQVASWSMIQSLAVCPTHRMVSVKMMVPQVKQT